MTIFGYLAIVAGVALLFFAALLFVFVSRLLAHRPTPVSEEIGSHRRILGKLRRREPMSPDEWELARQTVADRGSLLAFSLPAAIFTLGCLYVFGGLEAHGVQSLRPYIGVGPIFGSMAVTVRLLRVAALKKHLRDVSHSG